MKTMNFLNGKEKKESIHFLCQAFIYFFNTISLPFPVAGTVLSTPCSWHMRLAPSTGSSCNTGTQAGVGINSPGTETKS